jgi:hypothetical protein
MRNRYSRLVLSLIQNIECEVHSDPVNPRSKVGSSIEVLELAIASEECFLHDFVGVGLIFRNAESDTKDTSAVSRYKRAVSIFVSGKNIPDKRVIVISHSAH